MVIRQAAAKCERVPGTTPLGSPGMRSTRASLAKPFLYPLRFALRTPHTKKQKAKSAAGLILRAW
jgi:hypothetical protein